MLVTIQDEAALSSLTAVGLKAYLVSQGWENRGQWGSRPALVFAKQSYEKNWEILLPLRDTVADYSARMAESIAVLARVEERSQFDVYRDLMGAGADMIHVRSLNGPSHGPLSLRQSARLLNDTYDMLASVARAVETPRPTYRGPLSSEVTEFLDAVLPMTGDYQGYAITLHSPVPAGFGVQEDLGDDFYAPFPRRATLRLAEALQHSGAAITKVVAEDPLKSFQQAVSHGVSANFCDAVAELAKRGEGVEIGLSWAQVRPPAINDLPRVRFQFSEKSADVLTEAARTFRLNEPSVDETVIAQVVKLERDPQEFDGHATVLSIRDNHTTRIQVVFEEPYYNDVIRAFENRDLISVNGDIYRIGNGYELRNPRNLSIVPTY